jgi:hypothetical protein
MNDSQTTQWKLLDETEENDHYSSSRVDDEAWNELSGKMKEQHDLFSTKDIASEKTE